MSVPGSGWERAGRVSYLAFCAAVFLFLIAPILVIVPLSFNVEPYFTFTEGMLRLDPEAYSLRWYRTVAEDEEWRRALANSLIIGIAATALATALGTLAALGLASPAMPGRPLAMSLLISPMVTPVIISAAGMFFFYSKMGLAQTHLGLILAHAALGTPFVVITVTATAFRLRRQSDPGRRQPGRRAGADLCAGAVAHHRQCPAWFRARSSPSPPFENSTIRAPDHLCGDGDEVVFMGGIW